MNSTQFKMPMNAGMGGRSPDDMVVETAEAGPIIDALITRFDKSLTSMQDNGNQSGNGAVDIVAERAGESRGYDNGEAAARRLYDLREQVSTCISLDWYEAYLIAMDEELWRHEIPAFPGGKVAAFDMVEVHAEDWSEFEQHKLARSLWNFTRGYFAIQNHERRLELHRAAVERANLLGNFAPVELAPRTHKRKKAA